MKMELGGRTAIVTGGSKGIGYAVARRLAEANSNVVICARGEAEVAAAASELGALGEGAVIGVKADMRSFDDVRRLTTIAVERFGRLDILINNAGVGGFAPVDEISPQMWSQILETNLTGVFYASREAIPHMRERGEGWIINIGSLAGKNPFAGGAAYNASKFGLLGFSEAMMLDVRHHGIRVSCIMPGSVETHFSGPGSHSGADWKLQPDDIAEAVMDLLAFDSRALPSRVEIRPSRPPKK
jgi:NAD(P)-dependent dehydrogenase (short-subunit alcohol dehydrogenase family)